MRTRRLLYSAVALAMAVPLLAWQLTLRDTRESLLHRAIEIGTEAPDFTIDLLDGGIFTLTDHLERDGRPVLMNFWASWCLPCREEMPALEAAAARSRSDVFILGVAVNDTEAAVREFARQVDVSYALAVDFDGYLVERYPTPGLPTTWLITLDGTIAARWFGQLDQSQLAELVDRYLNGCDQCENGADQCSDGCP